MNALKFVYNVVQIMLCSYMCIEAVMIAYRNNYSLMPCVTFDQENPKVANLLWLFYVSKILDFADTVFIILGRKWNQLTFLHVYHHISIFLVRFHKYSHLELHHISHVIVPAVLLAEPERGL